jgi:hypothetical protein
MLARSITHSAGQYRSSASARTRGNTAGSAAPSVTDDHVLIVAPRDMQEDHAAVRLAVRFDPTDCAVDGVACRHDRDGAAEVSWSSAAWLTPVRVPLRMTPLSFGIDSHPLISRHPAATCLAALIVSTHRLQEPISESPRAFQGGRFGGGLSGGSFDQYAGGFHGGGSTATAGATRSSIAAEHVTGVKSVLGAR